MDLQKIIKESKGILLVYFGSEFCMHCKLLLPYIDKIKKPKVLKFNIQQDLPATQFYSIFSIPVVILFKDGKEFKRFDNIQSKQDIDNLIKICKESSK